MASFGKIDVYMNLCTRPAIFTPGHDVPKLGLEKGRQYNVDVFGLYQVKVDDDDVDAYFIAELPDGHCVYAAVDTIQFVDKGDDTHEPPVYCH